MPVRAGGGPDQHGLAFEGLGVEHVDEGLEKAAVGRAEHGADGDQAIRGLDAGDHFGEPRSRIPGDKVVGDVHGEVPQLQDLDVHGVAGRGKLPLGRGRQLVREQAA